MNVLYEEDGEFKVGAVLSQSAAAFQVESPHGRRSKVKATADWIVVRENGVPSAEVFFGSVCLSASATSACAIANGSRHSPSAFHATGSAACISASSPRSATAVKAT